MLKRSFCLEITYKSGQKLKNVQKYTLKNEQLHYGNFFSKTQPKRNKLIKMVFLKEVKRCQNLYL